MKFFLSLLLSLALLSGPAASAASAANPPLAAPPVSDTDYSDMQYIHYDPVYFTNRSDRLPLLAAAGDAEGVNDLYDELYRELVYVYDLTTLAMLRHDEDFHDEYWSEEYSYIYSVYMDVQNAFYSACSQVLDSGCAAAFTFHIGPTAAYLLRDFEGWSEEDEAVSQRELQLLEEYYDLYDTMDRIAFSYEGESWDLDKLYGFRGISLSHRDYDAYWAIYTGIQQAIGAAFAPLYIELVELWNGEARDAGYDNYIDYAYSIVYGRDYTPEEAQALCDAVKPLAREYYADLYYSDLGYMAADVSPVLSEEDLVNALGEYLPRIAPSLQEPWEQMTAHGLYDLAPAGAGRYSGCYTTNLITWHSPFLFCSLEGDCYDLISMTHEFGHYCDYWFTPQSNIITQVDNLDLSEIHSNALQALFTAFYDEIYDRHADAAKFMNLAHLLENIIDGCLYDEFQRRVLAETEPLTPEGINRIFTDVCVEYGMYDEQEWDSGWAYISHNFERPLYYISYAASAMAALQIWDLAQTDFPAAADLYLDVLRHGSYRDGYFEVMEACGLRSFTEEGAAETVCRPVLDAMAALDRAAG